VRQEEGLGLRVLLSRQEQIGDLADAFGPTNLKLQQLARQAAHPTQRIHPAWQKLGSITVTNFQNTGSLVCV